MYGDIPDVSNSSSPTPYTGTLMLHACAPQAMGFDFEEGDPEDPSEEMREESKEALGDEGEGALPEPDSEGRKMAESAEVRDALQQQELRAACFVCVTSFFILFLRARRRSMFLACT